MIKKIVVIAGVRYLYTQPAWTKGYRPTGTYSLLY